MTRRRILVLTRTTALGGAERLVMNSLPHLDFDSFDYAFAAFDDAGPLAVAVRESGLPFTALPGRRAGDPRALLAVRRMLLRERFDVVHAHLPLPGAIARIAARGLRTCVVYTEHTTQDVYRLTSRLLNAATYAWQDAVIAVADRVRESAESRIGSAARTRIRVIPNGVDLSLIDREAGRGLRVPPPRPDGAFTVLVPASLLPVKGHDVLLDSLARLSAGGPPVCVWLAGDGPLREDLERRAASLPEHVSVHLLGRRDDVFRLMVSADAVALPSRAEGLPLAVLEALCLGRAVVASAVGGLPEIVADGNTGILVPPGDVAALAEALEALRSDESLRQRLGAAAARAARPRLDIRLNVAAVEDLYRCALELPARETTPTQLWASRSLT